MPYLPGHSEVRDRFEAKRTADSCLLPLRALVSRTDDLRVLDCGCGLGSITCSFAQLMRAGKVIGIDLYPEFQCVRREKARQLARSLGLKNVSFRRGDVRSMRFADGEFDVVYSHALLDYFASRADVELAVTEMFRVCRPGGLIAYRVPLWSLLVSTPTSAAVDASHAQFTARLERSYGAFRDLATSGEIVSGLHRRVSFQVEVDTETSQDYCGDDLFLWASVIVRTLAGDAMDGAADVLRTTRDYCNWALNPEARIAETWQDVVLRKSS